MSRIAPLRVVHVDLEQGLEPVLEEPRDRDLFAVFWWRDLPLGQRILTPWQLAGSRSLAELVAEAVAPAVADALERETASVTASDSPVDFCMVRPLERMNACARAEPSGATLSVVVCTRDRHEALERCLRSIETLHVPPLETIVVDNDPADDATREVVRRFDFCTYVPEPTRGLSNARNTGIERSRGEIVAFTDDDTTVHPRWSERIVEPFRLDSVMAVTGLVLPAELDTVPQVVFEEAMGGFGRGYRRRAFASSFYERARSRGVPVWQIGAGANMAVRRRAFDQVGTFDVRLGAGASGCSEDSELWYRLLAEGWECRYEPSAVAFHYHRRSADELRRQTRAYLRGHMSALCLQYARYGDGGNLHRALLALPRHFARRALAEAGLGSGPRLGTYRAEIGGYLAGLRYLPLAFRSERRR